MNFTDDTESSFHLHDSEVLARLTPLPKIPLLGISISVGSYKEFIQSIIEAASLKTSDYVCLANVHMLMEAYHDPAFAEIVSSAYITAPDGQPLSWSLKILNHRTQDRVAGMDLLPDLLSEAAANHLPVYFYGGTTTLMEKTLLVLKQNYPSLAITGFQSPPFRKLTRSENEAVIEDINNSGAHLVFVVLGCPKQEKWMASMKGKINAVMIGIGGALPVTAGLRKRAPLWMQEKGLEWLFRLLQEPTRLSNRYYSTNTAFLYTMF